MKRRFLRTATSTGRFPETETRSRANGPSAGTDVMSRSLTLVTDKPEETFDLGVRIGALLPPESVVCLFGNLGSGKTTLVKGIARGLGTPESVYVTSPTYTLINEYPGRAPVFHADLYRLADPESLWEIGLFDLPADGGALLIEWADRLDPGDFPNRLDIRMTPEGESSRRIEFTDHGHVFPDLLMRLEAGAPGTGGGS